MSQISATQGYGALRLEGMTKSGYDGKETQCGDFREKIFDVRLGEHEKSWQREIPREMKKKEPAIKPAGL
jgi:hypothetical protein